MLLFAPERSSEANESYRRAIQTANIAAGFRSERHAGGMTAFSSRSGVLTAIAGNIVRTSGPVWHRAAIVLSPETRAAAQTVRLQLPLPAGGSVAAWLNGTPLVPEPVPPASPGESSAVAFAVPAEPLESGDAALLAIRSTDASQSDHILHGANAPRLLINGVRHPLAGRWQVRLGDDPSWSNMPLPAKFGAATEIVFPL